MNDAEIVRDALVTDDASFGHPDAITEEALAALDALVAALAAATERADAAERAERHVARAHRDAEAQLAAAREDVGEWQTHYAEIDAQLAAAREALSETIPYVKRATNRADPENAPWRIETAEGVLERVRAAKA